MTCRQCATFCLVAALLLGGCSSHNESQQAHPAPTAPAASATTSTAVTAGAAAQPAVRKVVEQFGLRMQTLSVLAPPPDVRAELPETYGKLITPGLMATWQADPGKVIGREGSSPWPTRIVIGHVACDQPDACHVTGKVDYITSNELEHGGVLYRRAITLDVTHTQAGWRIAGITLAPAPH